ncbi:MAG: glutathione peroxidase [Deltaproteobacteria bacterium]|nr:glutathione peroxidase [Deltaproteobacteria bacterium]
MTTFHQFEAKSLSGKTVSMSEFKDKVVVVVNTASKCGLTPQYEGLEQLYQKYKDHGLVILGFPCNQFMHQEPGDKDQISQTCYVNYGVSFPMFSKIDVNGKNAHPLFQFLKQQLKGALGGRIKWNFTKFLVGKDGRPIKRYAPTTVPKKLENDIEKALLGP